MLWFAHRRQPSRGIVNNSLGEGHIVSLEKARGLHVRGFVVQTLKLVV